MKKKKTLLILFMITTIVVSGASGFGESVSNPEWPLGLLMSGEDVRESYSLENNFVFDLDSETEDPFSGYSTFEMEAEKSYDFGSLYLKPQFSLYYGADSRDPELELKEGHLDVYLDKTDFRFGKQRVNWGKADGLVITNVINPQDLTTYPTIDFSDRFKNIYMVKMDYYQGMDTWEGVWIPEFEPVSMSDEVFKTQLKKIKEALPEEISKKFDPSKMEIKEEGIDSSLEEGELEEGELGFDLEETEYALQYSSMGAELDYEIMGGYLWDDHPTLHLDLDIDLKPLQPNQLSQTTASDGLTGSTDPWGKISDKISPSITRKHHRLSLVGGSASTSMGNFVFRGETLFTHGKRFNRQIEINKKEIPDKPLQNPQKVKKFLDSLADSFVVEKDQIEWMFGVDYSVDYLVDLLKFQVDQDFIMDYEDSIITDEYTTKMTFLAQGQYMRNDLTATANLIYDLNHESLTSKLQLDYNYDSSTNFVVGLDRILEEGEGLVSTLNRGAVYIQAEYLF